MTGSSSPTTAPAAHRRARHRATKDRKRNRDGWKALRRPRRPGRGPTRMRPTKPDLPHRAGPWRALRGASEASSLHRLTCRQPSPPRGAVATMTPWLVGESLDRHRRARLAGRRPLQRANGYHSSQRTDSTDARARGTAQRARLAPGEGERTSAPHPACREAEEGPGCKPRASSTPKRARKASLRGGGLHRSRVAGKEPCALSTAAPGSAENVKCQSGVELSPRASCAAMRR